MRCGYVVLKDITSMKISGGSAPAFKKHDVIPSVYNFV